MVKTVSLLAVKDNKLLVVLSKKHTLWTPPGGKVEPTDKNPQAALEREVAEELKIRLTNVREYVSVSGISASGRQVYVYTFFANIVGKLTIDNEIESIRWIGCTDEELKTVLPVTRDIMACMQADGYL